jgi:3-carboxy-cis,cis-muconate cycloisomerase
MSFSSLDSRLTGALFATGAMRAVFSDEDKLVAMLKVETALARAEAAEGLAPKGLARAIASIKPAHLDLDAIGRAAGEAGVVTIPFVKAIEARLPEKLRGHLHHGATSQDILDTALVLQMAAGFDLLAEDLRAIEAALARLARTHRKTPMIGRTYGQHAAPITFGYEVALWLSGIADVADGLSALRGRVLVVSLGGPVGTLATLGDREAAVPEKFAGELGLGVADAAWHSLRGRLAETGAWLAILIGALAKMATDVVSLSSTEIGEVAEPSGKDRGGSSAMPHKRNPISATVILAAHAAAPGLAATLFGAMAAAHQRPAGAWHGEWHALPQLFGLASGALREARRIAEGMTIDEARMRANLDLTGGLISSDAVAAALAPGLGRGVAHAIIGEAAAVVRDTGKHLRDVLADDVRIPEKARPRIKAAFDPAPAIEAAARAVDRVLALNKKRKP